MIATATKNNVGIGDTTGEGPNIKHVSETALWVAYYCAIESRRRDALFHDPYARVLAGERGEEIARTIPYSKNAAWSITVRTCLLDEIILRLIRDDEVDTVLNLGAGLDTRPYRLPLPASVNWIEVDLPGILEYKEEKLAGVQPICRLKSLRMNLADATGAKKLFAEVNAMSKRVLVLSEGLLAWLSREDVAATRS